MSMSDTKYYIMSSNSVSNVLLRKYEEEEHRYYDCINEEWELSNDHMPVPYIYCPLIWNIHSLRESSRLVYQQYIMDRIYSDLLE